MIAAARFPARRDTANNQLDLLEKQFHKRRYRYFVVIEG